MCILVPHLRSAACCIATGRSVSATTKVSTSPGSEMSRRCRIVSEREIDEWPQRHTDALSACVAPWPHALQRLLATRVHFTTKNCESGNYDQHR